jgi:hypothetical protein
MSEREYTTEELVAWLKQDAQFSEEHARLKYAVHPSVLGVALSECARTKAAAAEIERLTAALAAAPVREERVGECWCRRDMLGKRYFMCGWKLVAAYNNGCALTEPVMQGTTFCPHCGASLDADGTARRWKERDA